ncbi:1011_t:CDS:2 [Funneliformis geosporum]|nr:1011_t:CDS:2 [Funneliformis geosporum]
MDKVMADKIIFELEQEKKLVNRTALAEWFANGCPFEEDEEVLEFIKSEVREREARENGAGVTYSGSTGRQARLLFPQAEPKPPNFINTINIVVKVLDQARFPVQTRNVVMREFNGQELRLNPPVNVGDVVHKEGYLYCLILPKLSSLDFKTSPRKMV